MKSSWYAASSANGSVSASVRRCIWQLVLRPDRLPELLRHPVTEFLQAGQVHHAKAMDQLAEVVIELRVFVRVDDPVLGNLVQGLPIGLLSISGLPDAS